MTRRIDISGQRFGRFTVLGHVAGTKWRCVCDCGTEVAVAKNSLLTGRSKSCGCYRREHTISISTTHGMTGKPVHYTWKGMHQRCYNPNSGSYKDYGAKGVVICDRWHSFDNFYADMGDRPDGYSIDRIDPTGNYEPVNCRWANKKVQSRNKRNSVLIDGVALRYLAEELNIPYTTLYGRIWRAKQRAEEEGTKLPNTK